MTSYAQGLSYEPLAVDAGEILTATKQIQAQTGPAYLAAGRLFFWGAGQVKRKYFEKADLQVALVS